MTHQPPLFPLAPPADTVPVSVSRDGNGTYVATLYDWWYARGATAAEAAQRCVDSYEKETERLCPTT